jgi:hypothetical protein
VLSSKVAQFQSATFFHILFLEGDEKIDLSIPDMLFPVGRLTVYRLRFTRRILLSPIRRVHHDDGHGRQARQLPGCYCAATSYYSTYIATRAVLHRTDRGRGNCQ